MGLELTISLDRDIKELDLFFNRLRFKAVTTAARQALNRAATRTQSLAIRELRRRRKLKIQDLKGSKKKGKRGFVTTRKATGNDLSKLQSRVNFSGVPLPLIMFILGQKTPKTHRVGNARRRSRRFEIVKGKKKSKPGLFIQKAKRGTERFQVFRRKDKKDKSQGFKMQSAASVAEILRAKGSMLRKIENSAIAILQKEFDRALAFQLDKLKL